MQNCILFFLKFLHYGVIISGTNAVYVRVMCLGQTWCSVAALIRYQTFVMTAARRCTLWYLSRLFSKEWNDTMGIRSKCAKVFVPNAVWKCGHVHNSLLLMLMFPMLIANSVFRNVLAHCKVCLCAFIFFVWPITQISGYHYRDNHSHLSVVGVFIGNDGYKWFSRYN